MKSFIVVLFPALFSTALAQQADLTRHYQIQEVTVREVPHSQEARLGTMAVDNFTQGCTAESTSGLTGQPSDAVDPIAAVDMIDVIVDKIINIGKKIWAIVEAGRPVVNIKVDTANALPAGVKCWDELEGWGAPASKVYQVSYKNGFGVSVVSYAFRVSFISGGSYKGQGKYITLATFQPSDIYVAWGFNLDATGTVPMVFNQGSKMDPIAGMQLNMDWKVTSPLTEIRQAESFFVNGQGEFKKLQ